jgi:hypothetical protein
MGAVPRSVVRVVTEVGFLGFIEIRVQFFDKLTPWCPFASYGGYIGGEDAT